MLPLWFYKHQHDNRVRSTQNAFSLPFAAILVNSAPSGEMQNYCTPHIIKENSENFLIHRCNYILLSQVYCVWQVVKTPTIIFNNPVFQTVKLYQNMAFTLRLSTNWTKRISHPPACIQYPTVNDRMIQISREQSLHMLHMNNFPEDGPAKAETCLKWHCKQIKEGSTQSCSEHRWCCIDSKRTLTKGQHKQCQIQLKWLLVPSAKPWNTKHRQTHF